MWRTPTHPPLLFPPLPRRVPRGLVQPVAASCRRTVVGQPPQRFLLAGHLFSAAWRRCACSRDACLRQAAAWRSCTRRHGGCSRLLLPEQTLLPTSPAVCAVLLLLYSAARQGTLQRGTALTSLLHAWVRAAAARLRDVAPDPGPAGQQPPCALQQCGCGCIVCPAYVCALHARALHARARARAARMGPRRRTPAPATRRLPTCPHAWQAVLKAYLKPLPPRPAQPRPGDPAQPD